MATPGRGGVFSPLPGGGGRGRRTSTSTTIRDTSGDRNQFINRMLAGGGLSALNRNEQHGAQALLSPAEFAKYALGKPDPAPAAASGGGGGGGSMDANSLMEMYQKGLGAGTTSPDDQIRLMREANTLDLERKGQEQQMQMEGQQQALQQTQQARAKERETEAQLQRRQQATERGNAMAAFKGL